MKKITIAIDGYSSCGKSTMAKEIAKKLGYTYIDSGAMYRATTLLAIENGCFNGTELNVEKLKSMMSALHISFKTNNETGKPETYLNGKNVEKEIRTMEVSERVSTVAAVGFVRSDMVAQQQAFGKEKGVVMDGRDIGTTVFPDAELKLFVVASAEIRAQRRYDEMISKGQKANYEDILRNVKERDFLDQHREISPLRKADDAILLDNSSMSIEEQDLWLMDQFRKATAGQIEK